MLALWLAVPTTINVQQVSFMYWCGIVTQSDCLQNKYLYRKDKCRLRQEQLLRTCGPRACSSSPCLHTPPLVILGECMQVTNTSLNLLTRERSCDPCRMISVSMILMAPMKILA